MTTVNRYRIWCVTEQKLEYTYSTTTPTVCPVNPLHTIAGVVEEQSVLRKDITFADSPYEFRRYFIRADTTGGAITINLPPAVRRANYMLGVQNITGTNSVTVTAFGSELINGSSTQVLTADNEFLVILSNGSTWTIQADDVFFISPDVNIDDSYFVGQTGSILVDTGADTGVYNVGTDNYALVSDSSQAMGLRWTPILAGVPNGYQTIQQTATFSMIGITYTEITGLTLTVPSSGNYIVTFNTYFTLDKANKVGNVRVGINGVGMVDSLRVAKTSGSGNQFAIALIYSATGLTAADVISIQISTDSGTQMSVLNRELSLISF